MIDMVKRFAAALMIVGASAAVAGAQEPAKPMVHEIVLVHGAWLDGSGWKPVYDILTKDGYKVLLVQEPLTSFAEDVAATKRVLSQVEGQCILVGHSYGGSVITEAGNDDHVAGLVYIAAHMPEAGESEVSASKRFPSVLSKTAAVVHTADGFSYLKRDEFPKLFAPDLPLAVAEFNAASQVLTANASFQGVITRPAWRTKPSWMLVAGADQIINPDMERFYAKRAGSTMRVAEGASHSVYESRPKEVAAIIEAAAKS